MSLMAELQAKQKARQSVSGPPPPPSVTGVTPGQPHTYTPMTVVHTPAAAASPSGPHASSSSSSSSSLSGTAPPLPRGAPPPPPSSAQPPTRGPSASFSSGAAPPPIPASHPTHISYISPTMPHAGSTLTRPPPPVPGAKPPPPPAGAHPPPALPPHSPAASAAGGPPTRPASASFAYSYSMPPQPPQHAAHASQSHAPITVSTSEEVFAPDTPRGASQSVSVTSTPPSSHRPSASVAITPPVNTYSPSPQPVNSSNTAAPMSPLPQIPPFPGSIGKGTSSAAKLRRQLSSGDFAKPVYVNDGLSEEEAAEFRLDISSQPIKLASTVHVHVEQQPNRFVDDYVPAIPQGADALVMSTLTSFQRPIKAAIRSHVRYHKLTNANSTIGGAGIKDRQLVEFEIDEPAKEQREVAAAQANGGSGSGDGTPKKKAAGGAAGLADLFQQPPGTSNSPPPAATNGGGGDAASSPSSVTSPSTQQAREADELLRQAEIDSLCNPSLLHVQPGEARQAVDKDNELYARKEENFFLRSHPEYEYKEYLQKAEYTICKRLPVSSVANMWKKEFGTQLLISPATFRSGIGNVEPFFGVLALYDLKLGIRLTEDFHWDLNDNTLLTGQLEVNKSCADPITICPHALFSILDKHQDIVLICKLERILQGDPTELEHYHKLKQRTTTEMSSLVKKTRNNLIYLSDYRQTFGWCMLTLFEETGELRNFGGGNTAGSGSSSPSASSQSLAHERGPSFVRMDKIFQQVDSLKDELFIQMIRETRENISKGGKVYPGTYVDLRILEVDSKELPANRVDVSCIPLKDTETTMPVPECAEYNVAADMPIPSGNSPPGHVSRQPSMQNVPGTPTTPHTPVVPSTPIGGTSSGGSSTPSHSRNLSSSQLLGGLTGAALGPVAPVHTTTISNNPIPSPPIIREIEELTEYSPPISLSTSSSPPTPYSSYVNLLYIYPEFIKFEKFRNIACRVQFRNSDTTTVTEGMKVIYGKSSGSTFALSSLTQVNYHRKQVTPQDEIKIQLPSTMTTQTHLFFTFYKVSCKTNPGKREVIGMAVLPLLQKGKMLLDDTYHLSIAAKLPKNYLQPYAAGQETDDLHFRHQGIKCFSVRIKLVSSIFSQDEHIYSFLQTFPNNKELLAAGPHHGKELLYRAVEHIHKIHPWYTIKFLPPLLDYFFELIQNRGTVTISGSGQVVQANASAQQQQQPGCNTIQASYFGFLGLTFLIYKVSEYYVNDSGAGGNRCAILVAYIAHRLENLGAPVVVPYTTAGAASVAPHSISKEAGVAAGIQQPAAQNVQYVPLYSIFAKLWLLGLNPSATSDNATLFTLPTSAGSGGASSPSVSSPTTSSSPSSSPNGSSAGTGSTHQALHERLLISYAWFYFEVIYKSLVLERDRQKTQTGGYVDDANIHEFLKHFEALIQVIVSILYKHRTVGLTSVKHLIHNLALFFNDLFTVMEKERVVGLIMMFLNSFKLNVSAAQNTSSSSSSSSSSSTQYTDPVLIELKFTFYHILFDNEYFIDICETSTALPTGVVDQELKQETDGILYRVRARYPLISCFINDYVSNLARSRESLIRDKIITSLRTFLTKFDYDLRFQGKKKSDVALMFLPLIPAHLEELDMVLKTGKEGSENKDGTSSTKGDDDASASSQISTHKAHLASSSSNASNAPLSPASSPTNSSSPSAANASAIEDSKQRRNILCCVLWVLKNVPIESMRAWWYNDLFLRSGYAGLSNNNASGNSMIGGAQSREHSVSMSESQRGSSGVHNEGPFLELLALFEACLTSFPYVGLSRRETDLDTDCILAPETVASFQGDTGTTGVADIKSDIENLMANIHKTRALGGGTGTLRSARAGTMDKGATIGGSGSAVGGKSTLRQLRAQLSNKNATIGPGGLNMQMLAAMQGDSMMGGSGLTGGTIGRGASMSVAGNVGGTGLSSVPSIVGHGNTYRKGGTINSHTLATLNGGSAKDYVTRLCKWEGYLQRNVTHIIIQLLHVVLEDLHDFISVKKKWYATSNSSSSENETIETNCLDSMIGVLKLFTVFLNQSQSTSSLCSMFPSIILFVQRYGKYFHLNSSIKRHVGSFTSSAFKLCAYQSKDVRMYSVTLMYILCVNNYILDKNLFHLQMQLTISLSKLTENLSIKNEKYLQNSLAALMKLAAKASTMPSSLAIGGVAIAYDAKSVNPQSNPDFKTRLDTLLGRLSTILSDSMEISRQTKLGADADSATSENLLVQIADAFSHISEIRVEWLHRLAHHHQRAEQYAESAQCYIQMAQLVMAKPSTTGNHGEGYSMADSKTPQELDKLVSTYYEHACRMLDRAELYEQCGDVYKLLQPIYHKYLDYKSLSTSHYHLHQVYEKLMDANRKQSRMLGTYYRVGFYGTKFGERLHGNEFVYKSPKITRLSEIATRMKTLYSNQLGCQVQVLPDSNPVDVSKLKNIDEECWLQITFVSPSFLPDATPPNEFEQSIGMTSKPRNTWIECNTGLQAFKFSTPFTSGGKAFGSVTEQHKRNTVLYVKSEFPYILTAQSVVKRVETILSPIASATEDVILRTNSLLEVVASDTLSAKTLTGLLAGSVATQVHGGSKEICQAFLTDHASDDAPTHQTPPTTGSATHPPPPPVAAAAASLPSGHQWSVDEQEKLKDAMRAFLSACVLGLEANKKLSDRVGGTDAEREFQANLEQQFKELNAVIQPLIRPRHNKSARKSAKKGVRFG